MAEDDDIPQTVEEADRRGLRKFTYDPNAMTPQQSRGAVSYPCRGVGQLCLRTNCVDGERWYVYCDANLQCVDGRVEKCALK